MKWGMPHFTLSGKNVAGMAAFKAHCALIVHGDGSTASAKKSDAGMGGYGKISSIEDMPPDADILAALEGAAQRITQPGSAGRANAAKMPKPAIPVPDDFSAALHKNPAAAATFADFAPSQRREYLEWIVAAKREETRQRRIAQSVEWLAEGKRRNWKYEKS